MPALADFRHTPNALAPHYARFRVAERLLLTGHSHQAWPDAGVGIVLSRRGRDGRSPQLPDDRQGHRAGRMGCGGCGGRGGGPTGAQADSEE